MTTYAIDFEQPAFLPGFPVTNYVHGSITTDCNNCVLFPSDIVDWNLTLTIGQESSVLTHANSVFYPGVPGTYVASPTGLYYDFHAFLPGPSGFSTSAPIDVSSAPQIVFDEGSLGWATGTNFFMLYDTPSYPPTDLIGTPIAAVPEPATWALMLLGFVMVAWRRWRVAT
jgi:hypothetical protein